MKKLVRLLVLFVALGFAVVSCSEGEDTTAGGDLGGGTGGGTGGGGDNPSGSLGKLEDSEFIKNGNEIIGIDGAIDNTTSMIYFGEHPVWMAWNDGGVKTFNIKNNGSQRVVVSISTLQSKDSLYRIKCYDDRINCSQVTNADSLEILPNGSSDIEISLLSTALDKTRTAGNKLGRVTLTIDGKTVATLDLKLTLQPLAEKYLDLSVTETTIDFGDVTVDTKKVINLEFTDKGDVRDLEFAMDGETIAKANDGTIIVDSDVDNITTTGWSVDRDGKIDIVSYPTGQKDRGTLDRTSGSPFYMYEVIEKNGNPPSITKCNIYNNKKCSIPIVFYPATTDVVNKTILIKANARSPYYSTNNGGILYEQSFLITLKGNGVNP